MLTPMLFGAGHGCPVVAVDLLGQEGEPSSPVWYGQGYRDFYSGQWHQ